MTDFDPVTPRDPRDAASLQHGLVGVFSIHCTLLLLSQQPISIPLSLSLSLLEQVSANADGSA